VNGIETADETNACIWLVMRNGFEKDKTLIFDHLARREKSEEVDGIRDYPQEILDYHETYVDELRSNMSAPVEVVWGAPVRERMKKVYREKKNPLAELRLWGTYNGLSLFLEWGYPISTTKRELIRLIVFVMHPQMFLHRWGVKHAAVQDLKLMAAGKLAKVEMIPDFFQSRQLTTKSNFVKLVCSLERQKLEWAASEAVKAAKKRQEARASKLLQMHSRIVLSTFRLRKILQHYDELFGRDLTDVDETGEYSYLPEMLKEWLRDQQFSFFEGRRVSTAIELSTFHEKYCGGPTNTTKKDVSPVRMIQELLHLQQKHIRGQRAKDSILDTLTFYGFGERRVMQVECNHCQATLPHDEAARWATLDPESYVKKKAPSHQCSGIGRYYGNPKDGSISSCFPNKESLLALRRAPRTNWQRCVRAKDMCKDLPSKVQSWCIECKEKSRLSDGGNKCLDMDPRWTRGKPPKYIERRPNCLNCNAGSRFIPIDTKILSVGTQMLRAFADEFADLDERAFEIALGRRAPSRRTKRLVKSKRTLQLRTTGLQR